MRTDTAEPLPSSSLSEERETRSSSITRSSCTDRPDTNVNLLNVTHTSSAHSCFDNNHSVCHYFQSHFYWIKAHRFDKACEDNHAHFYFNKHSDTNITYQNSSLEYLIMIGHLELSKYLHTNYATLFCRSYSPF